MNKVLVDPAVLEEAAKWLEVHSPGSGSAEAFASEALREAIAQPAEALIYAPVEPSLEMQNAGWREIANQGVDPEELDVAFIYYAMLASCPTTI